MSMHLLTDTGGNAAPVPSEADEILLDLIRIVRGARAWCAELLPHLTDEADTTGLTASLRDAAAALVPATPAAGSCPPAMVLRALAQCTEALDRGGRALDALLDVARPLRMRRHGRCRRSGVPAGAERAVAVAVLRAAIVRAEVLAAIAADALDVSNGGTAGLPTIAHDDRNPR